METKISEQVVLNKKGVVFVKRFFTRKYEEQGFKRNGHNKTGVVFAKSFIYKEV